MINYETWKTLNESNFNLGLKGYPVVSGIVGNHLGVSEGGFPHDEDDVEEDDDDEDYDDEDDDDGEEGGDKKPHFGGGKDKKDDGLEGDLFGASKEEGPKKGFPPDDSEDMDGLPTPDQEMGGGKGGSLGGEEGGESGDDADMAKILGDVDPDMAFGADSGMTKLGDKTGDGLEDLMGGEEGGEMGDEMGGEMGGEEGPEMGGEEGGEMGGGEPCPECNPDGAEQEGDPQCPTCHGTGFMDDAEMGDDLKGIGDDLEGLGDDVEAGADDHKGAEHMAAGPVKVFNITHHHHHGGQGHGPVDSPNVANVPDDPMASMRKHMCAGGCMESTVGHADETQTDFFANLAKQAAGEPRRKFKSGLREDALFTAVEPVVEAEPKAGDVGFAPQSRVGAIGGGYTQADVKDIPVMESRKYLTLEQFMAKKKAAAKKAKK